jgi:hypothetical protein
MSNTKINYSQLITGIIVGLILAGVSAYFTLYQKLLKLETKSEYTIAQQTADEKTTSSTISDSIHKKVIISPDRIIGIIKEQQSIYVKESIGQMDYQCFTESDLQNFISKNIPNVIKLNLQKSNEYLTVVLAIKEMDPVARQNLLMSAQSTFKPTWEELGEISKKGQTEAGQNAEKLIAQAIVDLTKSLLKKSEVDINLMMN